MNATRRNLGATEAGLTLVELLVAIVASGIVLIGLSRLLGLSVNQYSMQEQVAELHRNTEYALRNVSEAIIQVGADLPDSGLALFRLAASGDDSVEVLVNQRGGLTYYNRYTLSRQSIAVDDARGYRTRDGRTPKVVRKPYDRRLAVEEYDLATSYNVGNYSSGVDTVNDSIRLTTDVGFEANDMLCCYVVDRYYLQNGCVYRNSDLLVENVDSLAIVFLDSTGTNATLQWDLARCVQVTVLGRTSGPILTRSEAGRSDRYARLLMRSKLRLRNKA